jgi:hypothetical protein
MLPLVGVVTGVTVCTLSFHLTRQLSKDHEGDGIGNASEDGTGTEVSHFRKRERSKRRIQRSGTGAMHKTLYLTAKPNPLHKNALSNSQFWTSISIAKPLLHISVYF